MPVSAFTVKLTSTVEIGKVIVSGEKKNYKKIYVADLRDCVVTFIY